MHHVGDMLDKRDELRDRAEARKHELLAKYNDLKADTRHEAIEARERVKSRLDELETQLKAAWTEMSEAARTKLTSWLEKDEHD